MGRRALIPALLRLAALLALAAVAARPLAAAAWTEYAVRAACPLTDDDVRALRPNPDFMPERGELLGGALDPWGRPFRYEKEDLGVRLWSTGPDGADQGGLGGDDVSVRETTLARRIDVAPRWFLGAALVLLWLAGARRAHQAPRSPRLAVEVARAAVIALGPIVGVVALAYPLSLFRIPALDAGAAPLLVSWPVAFAGTGALLALLAALWVRTRRPAADGERASRPGGRAWLPWAGVVVLVALAGGTTAWRDVRRERWSGPRVLMLAQLGVPGAIEAACLEPKWGVREVLLAHPPPVVYVRSLRQGANGVVASVAASGASAVEFMVSVLLAPPTRGSDHGRAVEFALDEHEATMRALAARIKRIPELRTRALCRYARQLVSVWGARGTVERLLPALGDTRRVEATKLVDQRVCDRAALDVAYLAGVEGLLEDATSPDEVVRRVRSWWAAGAPGLSPLRHLLLWVRRSPTSPDHRWPPRLELSSRPNDLASSVWRWETVRLGEDERSLTLRLSVNDGWRVAMPLDVLPEGCTVLVDIDWPTGAVAVRVVRHPD